MLFKSVTDYGRNLHNRLYFVEDKIIDYVLKIASVDPDRDKESATFYYEAIAEAKGYCNALVDVLGYPQYLIDAVVYVADHIDYNGDYSAEADAPEDEFSQIFSEDPREAGRREHIRIAISVKLHEIADAKIGDAI